MTSRAQVNKEPIACATDFEKLRQRRRRTLFFRRLVVLAIVAGLIYSSQFVNTFLVEHQLPTRVTNFFGQIGGPGFPVRMPAGNLEQVRALGSDIAVINGANLHLYSRSGRELLSAQRIGQGATVLTAGSRMLIYTFAGQELRVYFQNRRLFEGEHDSPIRTAALGARGNYAIVSSTMQFRSQLTVFNDSFEQQFQWNSSELVTLAALCPGGSQVAVGSIDTRGGVFFSGVTIFALDREAPLSSLDFHNQLILGMEYISDGRIAVITDHGLRVIEASSGRVLGSYDITGDVAFSRLGDGLTLLLSETPEDRTQTAILFGVRGQELGRADIPLAVRDMQVGNTGVYILSAGGIKVFDHAMNERGKLEQVGIERILLAGDVLYYFVYGEIRVFELTADEYQPYESYI